MTKAVSAETFLSYYWLKEELVAFCRAEKLPTSGSKQDVTKRIAHYLETGEIQRPVRKPSRKTRNAAPMPTTFTRDTVIEAGWKCNQDLRAFFEAELGKKFHFNVFMRAFIKEDGVGKTLQEAIDGWIESKNRPKGSSEISSQFEYNIFTREYYKNNAGATRDEVIAAWKAHRAKPKE